MVGHPNHYVLVTGGRDPEAVVEDEVRDCLVWLHGFYGERLRVLHGGARGVDSIAQSVCGDLGIIVKAFPADWDTHGKKAGPIRNAHMAKLACSWVAQGHTAEVLAFDGGYGTANMKKIAVDVGLTLTTIPENGRRDDVV